MQVCVVDSNQQPLMPTTSKRAASWIRSKKATPFWKRGVFCVRLNVEPASRHKQDIVVAIDPGSMKEGYTVKSEAKTFLNIQSNTVTDVKEKLKARKTARKHRRYRKSPYRKNRTNRSRSEFVPPSTKARWDLKLRILAWIRKIYPVTHVIVEDIKAPTKPGHRKWNVSFSPLEYGKNWFYDSIRATGLNLSLIGGFGTSNLRKSHGLKKTKAKLSEGFDAHCVDSWVMANSIVGGHTKPDNESILFIRPLRWSRRQLHMFQFAKGGKRQRYGSTRSMGFTRGSLVKHPKYGLAVVGGTSKNRVSLHDQHDFRRLSQEIRPESLKFKSYMPWITRSSLKPPKTKI